jgi:hypothetical protein
MDEIALCAVDLDYIEANTIGAPSGIRERRNRAFDTRLVEHLRRIATGIRYLGGTEWRPATLLERNWFLTLPRG